MMMPGSRPGLSRRAALKPPRTRRENRKTMSRLRIASCTDPGARGGNEDDLRHGSLLEVLQAFSGRTRTFSLLYPADRHMPVRVRVLVDFLMEQVTGATGSESDESVKSSS